MVRGSYEYTAFIVDVRETDAGSDMLTTFGHDGWRVVSCCYGGLGRLVYTLERPLA